MKKLFLTMGLAAISAIGIGQEVVKRSDLYQDPSTYLLSQFVIEVEGKTASELKNNVELWASSAFVNTNEVIVAEGDNYIVYKPLLIFYHNAGGLLGQFKNKFTIHTKFEFKENRVRVTLIDMESTYVTPGHPTVSRRIWESNWGEEIKNKGMWKPSFRQMKAAIDKRNNWIRTIEGINFNNPTESSDW